MSTKNEQALKLARATGNIVYFSKWNRVKGKRHEQKRFVAFPSGAIAESNEMVQFCLDGAYHLRELTPEKYYNGIAAMAPFCDTEIENAFGDGRNCDVKIFESEPGRHKFSIFGESVANLDNLDVCISRLSIAMQYEYLLAIEISAGSKLLIEEIKKNGESQLTDNWNADRKKIKTEIKFHFGVFLGLYPVSVSHIYANDFRIKGIRFTVTNVNKIMGGGLIVEAKQSAIADVVK